MSLCVYFLTVSFLFVSLAGVVVAAPIGSPATPSGDLVHPAPSPCLPRLLSWVASPLARSFAKADVLFNLVQ